MTARQKQWCEAGRTLAGRRAVKATAVGAGQEVSCGCSCSRLMSLGACNCAATVVCVQHSVCTQLEFMVTEFRRTGAQSLLLLRPQTSGFSLPSAENPIMPDCDKISGRVSSCNNSCRHCSSSSMDSVQHSKTLPVRKLQDTLLLLTNGCASFHFVQAQPVVSWGPSHAKSSGSYTIREDQPSHIAHLRKQTPQAAARPQEQQQQQVVCQCRGKLWQQWLRLCWQQWQQHLAAVCSRRNLSSSSRLSAQLLRLKRTGMLGQRCRQMECHIRS